MRHNHDADVNININFDAVKLCLVIDHAKDAAVTVLLVAGGVSIAKACVSRRKHGM